MESVEKRFTGKTVLITGGSRGIGRATAIEFAKEGANVIFSYNKTKPEEIISEIKKYTTNYLACKCDVRNYEEIKEMVKRGMEKFGKIDILINNAGILTWKPFLEVDEKTWRNEFEVNIHSCFYVTKEVVQYMIKEKYGRIVFVSSIVGKQGSKGANAYATTKAAMLGMARSLALELAPYGIITNSVAPSYIETDLVNETIKKNYKKIIEDHPVGRVGRPEEVARAILFLSSDEAPFINGETINLNGGRLRD